MITTTMATIANTTNIEGTIAAVMIPVSSICEVEEVDDGESDEHVHEVGTSILTVEFDVCTRAVSFNSTRFNSRTLLSQLKYPQTSPSLNSNERLKHFVWDG